MEDKNEKEGLFFTFVDCSVYFPLFSQVTFSMTQPVSSEEHDNLFRATEEFKKYQENIVPETPLASEPITDIDGNQIGWYIQYEVMVVNNDSIVKIQ